MQHVWNAASPTHGPVLELMCIPELLRVTVQGFVARVPQPWRAAAIHAGIYLRIPPVLAQGAVAVGAVATAARTVLEGWGWVPCSSAGEPLPGKAVPLLGGDQRVRNVTSVLLHPVVQQRVVRHREFVVAAAEPTAWSSPATAGPAAPNPPLQHTPAELELLRQEFVSSLPALWAVPMDNRHKDAFWRLSVNGVPGAGGHDICLLGPCPCGWRVDALACTTPDRKRLLGAPAVRAHTFWSCPVARAVVRELSQALPAGVQLHRKHVWLAIPPCAEVVLCVWQVVCMAAVAAMERGRRTMWSAHFTRLAEPAAAVNIFRQQTLAEAWGLQPNAPFIDGAAEQRISAEQFAARAAVADFWTRLDDFVTVLPDCGRVWHGSAGITPAHPFICASQGLPHRLQLNVPVTVVIAGPVGAAPAVVARL